MDIQYDLGFHKGHERVQRFYAAFSHVQYLQLEQNDTKLQF